MLAFARLYWARLRLSFWRYTDNTAGLTFLNLDWANRSAATLTCTACGRIEWFLADPEEMDEESGAPPHRNLTR
jgi:hypothetical protein